MVDSIKITALQDIGANIMYTTLVPVVDMSGTPITKKSTLQNLGNLILGGAGGSYFPRAAQATLALSVANADQPNITSVGTLTSLNVSGNITVGNADLGNYATANFFVGDGGFLSNVTVGGLGNIATINLTGSSSNVLYGNGTFAPVKPGGATTQIQFNNSGTLAGSANLIWDSTNQRLAAKTLDTANLISSNTSQIGITPGAHPNSQGPTWTFDSMGGLYWPATGGALWVIEPNIDGEFEFKSTSNIVISTDISNTNAHFTFDSQGIFTAPSNVNLLGTRLNIGADSPNITLETPTIVIADSSNTFVQTALFNNDANGSADWVAYGEGGSDIEAWTDMGYAGHNFSDPAYTITPPGDGYLFVQGYANGVGGNMVLATGENGNTADIVFATGGFTAVNEFARIENANNLLHLTRANSGIQFHDGTILTTASGASTGNLAFIANTMYSLGGVIIENADLTHGSTASLLLPPNGDAANAVQLTNTYGNVVITAGSNSNTVAWTFDSAGNLATPSNLVIGANGAGGSSIYQYDAPLQVIGEGANSTMIMGWTANTNAPGDVAAIGFNTPYSSGAGNVQIVAGNNSTTVNYWNFDNTGALTLPGNGYIVNPANSSLDPIIPNVSTMLFTPDANYSYQALVLDPTAPGHIHLRAPSGTGNIDEPVANIFLGGEASSFEVGASYGGDPNVFVHSGGNTWTFGTDGNLTLPSNTFAVNYANGSPVPFSGPVVTTEPITLTTDSADPNPTKADTTITDWITVIDNGTGWIDCSFSYSHASNVGADNGLGSYLFALPNGLQFDSTYHPFNTDNQLNTDGSSLRSVIPGSTGLAAGAGYQGTMVMVPYDATHFRIVNYPIQFSPNSNSVFGTTNFIFANNTTWPINGANVCYSGSFRFKKV